MSGYLNRRISYPAAIVSVGIILAVVVWAIFRQYYSIVKIGAERIELYKEN